MIVKEVYGTPKYEKSPLAIKILEKLKGCDVFDDTKITVDKFKSFSERHPAMLFPAFKLQYEMREAILGKKWWDKGINCFFCPIIFIQKLFILVIINYH